MENKTPETTTETKVGLSSPWITYYRKINALFGVDPDLDVKYNDDTDDTKTISIESTNTFKIMALEKLLKPSVTFGNITVSVKCLVKNDEKEAVSALFKTAFSGNPHLSDIIDKKVIAVDETFVLFKKEVIQFFNDDCTDYFSNWNGLAEDILRTVMNEGILVNIGTDIHSTTDLNEIWNECCCCDCDCEPSVE